MTNAFQGRPADGIPLLKRAIEIDPQHSTFEQIGLGVIYVMLGDPNSAIPLLQKGIQTYPGFPDTYAWLAMAYELKGNKAQVQATTVQLFKIAPGFRAKDLDQALSSCTPAAAAFWNEHVGAVAARVGIPP